MPISFSWAWKHDAIDIRGKWILEAFCSIPSLFRNIVSYQAISNQEFYIVFNNIDFGIYKAKNVPDRYDFNLFDQYSKTLVWDEAQLTLR